MREAGTWTSATVKGTCLIRITATMGTEAETDTCHTEEAVDTIMATITITETLGLTVTIHTTGTACMIEITDMVASVGTATSLWGDSTAQDIQAGTVICIDQFCVNTTIY